MSRSPFKFLDAYTKDDRDRFFGRERETAQLYNAVHASSLVLVYGGSGTGKTSLINCGLGNQFLESDWLPLYVRRGTNLNEALARTISAARKGAPNDDGRPIVERLRALYLDHYRPVYLIFDQFEELYIEGGAAERRQFYDTVRQILDSPSGCKILFVIREEYIAYLSEFEKVVRSLFDNRLRIEKLNDTHLARIIVGTAHSAGIEVVDPPATVAAILDNIRDRRTGVDLADLQIYLDRLWREDLLRQMQQTSSGASAATMESMASARAVRFDAALAERVGRLEKVFSDFMDEQMEAIEKLLSERGFARPQGVPFAILYTLVTDEGTKRNLDVPSILEKMPKKLGVREQDLRLCLEEFERIRLVRPLGAG